MALNIDQTLQQGILAHKRGEVERAERLYRAILESQPLHPDANHNLGLLAVSVNKFDAAVTLFKTAIDGNPKIGQIWLSYIDALIKGKQFDNAKEVLEQAKKQGVAGEKLNILEAQLTSINETADFSRASPSKVQLNSLIECYQNGRFGDAENLAISLTKQFPEHQLSWKVLGAVLQLTDRIPESLFAKQKAVELDTQDAESHNNLGSTLKVLGRLKEAEANYTQAIELKPDYAEAHNNLGVTLQELGRLKEAEANYTQAIELKPDYAEAHNNLGNMLKVLGKSEEAEASYTKAIALKPDYSSAHNNLGILFFESRKYNLAAEEFELTDTNNSRMFSIKCSFLQDTETMFYEKFDHLVSLGERNAVIGSLSFRSEFKYGTKKSNPFCNDPLSYVVNTDLKELYDFEDIFIETARDVLTDNSVSYKAQGHLTNGVQTAGNIFAQGKVPKTELESIIHTEIEKYRTQFKDSDEGFINNWPTNYEIKGWLICMKSGGKLAPHMHDNGWITGSIYINVPPKSKTDNGNLVLCLTDQEHVQGAEKNQQSIIDVVTGSLCLFPSSLHHYTVPFEEKEDRIVLAFDVIKKN
jgi:tetratricopeptide (TPR) repeat protein